MRLLLACIQGLAWPPMEPPPFLNQCLEQSAAGPLQGFPGQDQAWLINGVSFWSLLSQAGLQLGVMNLPGLWPAQEINGFMVCRGLVNDAGHPWTHPRDLSHDLGDYVQPRHLPAEAPQWRPPLKDTAFAEAAALARLRYEHFRRLCARRRVDVGAIGWSALAKARRLFNGERERADLMLAQLDAYLARLHQEFQPQALVVAGMVEEGQTGLLAVLAPELVKPVRLPNAAWPGLLPSLMVLAGLSSPTPEHVLADARQSGDLLS